MSDEYVRKDLYDEGIKRIEAMMAASEAQNRASEARHREYAAKQDAKYDAQIAEIRGEVKQIREQVEGLSRYLTACVDSLDDTIAAYVDGLSKTVTAYANTTNQRIDDITKKPSLTERIVSGAFAVIGTAIGLAAVVVAGVQVYLAWKGAK